MSSANVVSLCCVFLHGFLLSSGALIPESDYVECMQQTKGSAAEASRVCSDAGISISLIQTGVVVRSSEVASTVGGGVALIQQAETEERPSEKKLKKREEKKEQRQHSGSQIENSAALQRWPDEHGFDENWPVGETDSLLPNKRALTKQQLLMGSVLVVSMLLLFSLSYCQCRRRKPAAKEHEAAAKEHEAAAKDHEAAEEHEESVVGTCGVVTGKECMALCRWRNAAAKQAKFEREDAPAPAPAPGKLRGEYGKRFAGDSAPLAGGFSSGRGYHTLDIDRDNKVLVSSVPWNPRSKAAQKPIEQTMQQS